MLISAIYAYQPKYKNRECCFMLNSAFNAYQWDNMAAFNAYQCGKEMKSIYLETTTFLATVCPTRVFCSRQIQ
jgi:hypothetical protein